MISIEPYFRFSFLIDICLVLILFIRFSNVNNNRLVGIKTIDSVKNGIQNYCIDRKY